MNFRHAFFPVSIAVTAALAACSSTPSNLQTATGDTKPQPVVVQVPVEITTPELEAGCWVQFYSDRNFKGEVATLVGPASLESADKISGKKLKRNIDSLVTGAKATLKVYEHAMFKDRTMVFGPNSREAGLITKLGIGGQIESLQLDCGS
jgi:hypothetical protein